MSERETGGLCARASVVAGLLLAACWTASALPERRVNTDESKVPPYAIEDVLVSTNGTRLTSAAQWPERRRELLALIERELYGKWPAAPETLVVDEGKELRTFYDLARIRQFAMYFRADRSGPRIDWMLLEPVYVRGAVPLIVMLNYRGNHEHLAESGIGVSDFWVDKLRQRGATPNRIDASVRGQMRYPYDLVLARGYAVLTACYHQAAPDPLPEEMPLAEVRSRGLYRLWTDKDVGTLAVWGWTMCRRLDLAARLPELDMRRTVAYGYSRLAKAALIAGAFDERFAVVVPCQPGGGGVALQKRQFGENADWMTQVFPHWFCAAYQKYANNEAAMPMDQHFLVAAVAPRRLLVQGFDEPWYDTKGEWLSCQAASPVWELLGRRGLSAGAFPEDFSTAATAGDIGYVRRPGTHGISGYDWMWMLDFADASWRATPHSENKSNGAKQ